MRITEIRFAKRMVNARQPWPQILAYFNHRYSQQEIAEAVKQNKKYIRESSARRRETDEAKFWAGIVGSVSTVQVPKNVLEERQRRVLLDHRDLTSRICGDPLPGYSALEKVSA